MKWVIVLHNTKACGKRLESIPQDERPSEQFARQCADLYGASKFTIEPMEEDTK